MARHTRPVSLSTLTPEERVALEAELRRVWHVETLDHGQVQDLGGGLVRYIERRDAVKDVWVGSLEDPYGVNEPPPERR